MLSHLSIENIAVIERAEIGFSGGFHVLTGETGAGKSILIDAICAVLGERTSRELIRTGCESATVSAEFTDLPASVSEILSGFGLPGDEDVLILQRILHSSGKSVCRINGRPVTAAMLREIGDQLLNIHGQHDSQALLQPERHGGYLDLLADNGPQYGAYREIYDEIKSVIRELRRIQMDETEQARKTELLTHQIEELETAKIQSGERAVLNARRLQIQNAERIALALEQTREALGGSEEIPGAGALLESAAEALSDIGRFLPATAELTERLSTLAIEVTEIGADVRTLTEDGEYDPKELAEIEDRLDLLYRLSRKYGETEEDMLQFLENARQELDAIQSCEARILELENRRDLLAETLLRRADRLTASRKQAAALFERRVCEELTFLDMPDVRFVVLVEPAKPNSTGADRIEFLISPNPGEPPKPLSKIASGGELSRIMLAIKNVLADKDSIPTLIFDEIDAGISGRAAQKVGVKLRQTAGGRQIICVTHLAQIAALAHHQLLIEKQVRGGRTYTSVRELDEEGRIRELARIIGGAEITDTTLRSAREMLEQARQIT